MLKRENGWKEDRGTRKIFAFKPNKEKMKREI